MAKYVDVKNVLNTENIEKILPLKQKLSESEKVAKIFIKLGKKDIYKNAK